MTNYKNKYLKYKLKYLKLIGGCNIASINQIIENSDDYLDDEGEPTQELLEAINNVYKYNKLIKKFDYDNPLILDASTDGESFFRKETTTDELNIVKIIKKNQEKLKNVVEIKNISEQYYDMELLKIIDKKEYDDMEQNTKNKMLTDIFNALEQLHSIGIIFIDLKISNIGYDTSKQIYKLFDFNASGIFDINTGEWIQEPVGFKYNVLGQKFVETSDDVRQYDIKSLENFDALDTVDFWY